MTNVYILCGIPGSGKSFWAQHHIKPGAAYISRDTIRFSLLKEGEPYFSHENEVYDVLWDQINGALSDGRDVFVDQTSLNKKSRKFLIDHLTGYNKINVIWFDTPLEVALERNEQRKGLAKVPRGQIRRMYYSFEEPTFEEGFDKIFKYKDNKMTMKKR